MLTRVWRANALGDLEEIIGFIAERNFTAAERLQTVIEALADQSSGGARVKALLAQTAGRLTYKTLIE